MVVAWDVLLILGEGGERLIKLCFLGLTFKHLNFTPGTCGDQTSFLVANRKYFLSDFGKAACKRLSVSLKAQISNLARFLQDSLRNKVLIWRLVRWMEWVFLTDSALLDVHFLIVAVVKIHFVEVINHALPNRVGHLFLTLGQLFIFDFQIYVVFEATHLIVESFTAGEPVMRVKFIERIRVKLVATVHQERSEWLRLLRRALLRQLELVPLTSVSLGDCLLQ